MKNIKNDSLNQYYESSDLAIIIPTKDRPKEINRLLNSIYELDCKAGRIIVIASGMDITNQVMLFSDKIPVECYLVIQVKSNNQ